MPEDISIPNSTLISRSSWADVFTSPDYPNSVVKLMRRLSLPNSQGTNYSHEEFNAHVVCSYTELSGLGLKDYIPKTSFEWTGEERQGKGLCIMDKVYGIDIEDGMPIKLKDAEELDRVISACILCGVRSTEGIMPDIIEGLDIDVNNVNLANGKFRSIRIGKTQNDLTSRSYLIDFYPLSKDKSTYSKRIWLSALRDLQDRSDGFLYTRIAEAIERVFQ